MFDGIIDSVLGWFSNGGARNTAVKWVSDSIAGWITGDDKQEKKYSVGQPPQPQTDEGIRLTQYGTVIPRVNGTQLIQANAPFWRGDLIVESFQSQNGVQYNYFMDLAYVLCVGQIDGVYRVWENNELRAQYGTDQNKLPGTLYTGSLTQTADPIIAAAEGAANTPAFRGVSYIVMEKHYLGNSVTLPSFQFEIVKSGAL